MLTIPVPFVVALILSLMGIQAWRAQSDQKMTLPFYLLALYIFQSILVGIRWGYDWTFLLPLQSLLAACWPVLAWWCLTDMQAQKDRYLRYHVAWPVAMILLIALYPDPIDILLILEYLFYAIFFLLLSQRQDLLFPWQRLQGDVSWRKLMVILAATLFVFALIDGVILLDMRFLSMNISASLIGWANLPIVVIISWIFLRLSEQQTQPDSVSGPAPALTPETVTDKTVSAAQQTALAAENQLIVKTVEDILIQTRLYCDPDLSLMRLARRTGYPARTLSRAINQVSGKNLSQYVNQFRIAAACDHLKSGHEPITQIMLKCGFYTKSNFNRVFKEVTGDNPRQWRLKHQDSALADYHADLSG